MGYIDTIVQFVTLFIQYELEDANLLRHPGHKCTCRMILYTDARQYLNNYQVKKN